MYHNHNALNYFVLVSFIVLSSAFANTAFAGPEVTVRSQLSLTSGLTRKSRDQFVQDLTDLAKSLVNADDPNVEIVITNSFRKHTVETEIHPGQNVTITIPAGLFAFTQNLNEVAGILSYQIAKLKYAYEKRFGELIADQEIPKDKKPTEYLKEKIQEIETIKDPDFETLEKKRKLKLAQDISLQKEKYQKRNTNLQEIMARSGFKMDLNDKSEVAVKASKEAVDRLVDGGFDPWGILTPLHRITDLEREVRGPITYVTKGPVKKTINSELEFTKNYILFLEQKKVDITQQPYRGRPLTSEQAVVQKQAVFVQHASLGGAAREWLGLAGVIGVGGYMTKVAMEALVGSAKHSAEKAAEPVKLTGKESWIEIKEWFESVPGGKAIQAVFEQLQPYMSTASVVWLLKQGLMDTIRQGVRILSNRFSFRYRKNLEAQTKLSLDLLRWKIGKDHSIKELIEITKTQEALSDFILDGIQPKEDKVESRVLYQILYGDRIGLQKWLRPVMTQYVSPKDPKVAEILLYYEKKAQHALEQEYRERKGKDPSPGEFSKSKIKDRAKQIAFQELFVKANTKVPESLPDKEREKIKDADYESFQGGFYRSFGILSDIAANKNVENLILTIRTELDKGNVTAEEKAELQEVLKNFSAMEFYGPDVKNLYLDTLATYFPEISSEPFEGVEELNKARSSGQISETVYKSKLSTLSRSPGSSEETVRLLNTLVDQKMYLEAAKMLSKNLEVIAGAPKLKLRPGEIDLVPVSISRLFTNWDKMPMSFWNRRILKDILFLKTISIKDPNARLGLYSHLQDSNVKGPPLLKWPINYVYRKIFENSLKQVEEGKELLERLEVLSNDYNTESKYLADYFYKMLKKKPTLVETNEDISRVLESPFVWHKLEYGATPTSNWELGVYKKYSSFSKKYEPYVYNPSYSENLQRALLNKYKQLNPNASLEGRMAFWEKMASRGATGVTDSYFDILFNEIENVDEKTSLAKEVLERGLVWDEVIKTKLYKIANEAIVTDHMLEEKSSRTFGQLKDLIKKLPKKRSLEAKAKKGKDIVRFMKEELHFQDESDRRRVEKKTQDLINRSMREALSKEDFKGQIEKFLNEEQETISNAARIKAIDREMNRISKAFPETGHASVQLLDWVSYRLGTTQTEAFYLRDKITKNNSNQDLGYVVVNEIVEEALYWNKVDRWKLIRWLRGTGPAPEVVTEKLKKIGPETIRRLYATLPIFLRQGFMGALIGSPREGLLKGIEKHLYYEQILNEILPADKGSAKVANDLLKSFLKSVEKVSHPEKKISVLAYLLANHAENSNTGTVLRNVLEAYGVTGVKLGQLLAASDILPEHIRKELGKLRDQANEPYRHEIYERLQEVLKTKDVSKKIQLKNLLGAASIKYAVKVRDNSGEEHVIQIKREEAEASISRDFKQLEIIVDDLIKQKPKQYAFLRGMVSATKAAIWRELSLVRESEKTDTAIQEYGKLNVDEKTKIKIPENSPLIEELGGPKTRFFYLRSSEFVDGRSIERYPPETQAQMATEILKAEHQLLFPIDDRDTHFDPDRHPGNNLLKKEETTGEIGYHPIDWGQLLKLTPNDRKVIIRLMSYSQIFELIGPNSAVFQKFTKEFGFQDAEAKLLLRALNRFFPNTSGKPHSSLSSYYYLLSEMESAGFKRSIVNYDFIKGIYQLEFYEGFLAGKKHVSPKETFADLVEKEIKDISKDISTSKIQKLTYFLRNPKAAMTTKRNVESIQAGRLEYDKMLQTMGLSKKAQALLIEDLPKEMKSGQDVLQWIKNAGSDKKNSLSKEDSEMIERWTDAPSFKSINPELISASDFTKLMTSMSMEHYMRQNAPKDSRKPIAQPEKVGFIGGTANVYTAELLNAIFWSLWDKDEKIALRWLEELKTLDKHLGYGAFAIASGLYSNVTNRAIPMSYSGTRYFSGHGVSMAVGMLASDIARRIYHGQPVGEILDHITSSENLKDLGYGTAVFMAAGASIDKTGRLLGRNEGLRRSLCQVPLRELGRTALVFILAEGIQRNTKEPLTELGVLDRDKLAEMTEIGKEHFPKIQADLDDVRVLLEKKKRFEALKKLTGFDDYMFTVAYDSNAHDINYKKWEIHLDRDTIERRDPNPDSFFGKIDDYVKRLQRLEIETMDTFKVSIIEKEIKTTQGLKKLYYDQIFINDAANEIFDYEEIKNVESVKRQWRGQ